MDVISEMNKLLTDSAKEVDAHSITDAQIIAVRDKYATGPGGSVKDADLYMASMVAMGMMLDTRDPKGALAKARKQYADLWNKMHS